MMENLGRLTRTVERISLAMAGIACGTFVAASVGRANVAVLQSDWASLVIIAAGGIGFSIVSGLQYGKKRRSGIDPVCLLCASGTFLASVMALISVVLLVVGADPSAGWLSVLAAGWIGGVVLQIMASALARYGDHLSVQQPRLVAAPPVRDAA
jgi:hypothetical protein